MKSLRTRRHRAIIEMLRTARQEAGLTQQQLARKIKRPQSFVSMYETGDRRVELAEFLEIAAALGRSASELIRQVE